jgi:hypothetical protein
MSILPNMKVVHINKYHGLQQAKYSKACREWKPSQGGFPQAAFYFFSKPTGEFYKSGYVAFGDGEAGARGHKAVLRRTKKEAVEAFYK